MSAKILGLVCLSAALAACSTNPLEVVISRCPAVAVIGDISTWTEFKPGATTKTSDDLAYTATISEIDGGCTESDDVVSAVDFSIYARKYDGYGETTVSLPYFVAIVKDNNSVISKKNFTATITFDQDGLGESRNQVLVDIPTIEQSRTYRYEILLGFDVEPTDIYYNLAR